MTRKESKSDGMLIKKVHDIQQHNLLVKDRPKSTFRKKLHRAVPQWHGNSNLPLSTIKSIEKEVPKNKKKTPIKNFLG